MTSNRLLLIVHLTLMVANAAIAAMTFDPFNTGAAVAGACTLPFLDWRW